MALKKRIIRNLTSTESADDDAVITSLYKSSSCVNSSCCNKNKLNDNFDT